MTGWRNSFLSPGRLLRLSAARHGGVDMVAFEGTSYTYRVFNRQVNALAGRLSELGIGTGDRIQILSENGPDYVRLMFAANKIGAVSIPTNAMLVEHELAGVLRIGRPKMFFASRHHLDLARGAIGTTALDGTQLIELTTDGEESALGPSLFSDLDGTDRDPTPRAPVGDQDPGVILFSSGSTGMPKGIVKSNGSLVWSAINRQIAEPRRPGDREAFVLPLAGIAFANFLLTDVLSGATCLLLRRWDPEAATELLGQRGTTHVFLAPTMMVSIDRSRPGVTFPGVQVVETSFEFPMSNRHLARRLFPNAAILWSYGSTEAAMARTPPEYLFSDPGCVGYASGLDEFAVDANGDLDDGEHELGEIRSTGPTVMLGYLSEDEDGMTLPDDGWLRTGDLGWIDDDSALHFSGREKDMIKSGGSNVFAREVELVLMDHPAVAQAAVIGIPDEYWGESVVAFVETAASVTIADLQAHVESRLAPFRRPKSYFQIDEIPRNPTGKVAKGVLRDQVLRGAAVTLGD